MDTTTRQVKPKKIRKPSLRAQKAVLALVAKGGTKAEALREAGYSEAIARNPERVFDSPIVKPIVDEAVARMIKLRDKYVDALEKKDLDKVQFKHISDALAKMNHDIQLLSGNATENVAVKAVLTDERRQQLDNVLGVKP